MDRVVGAVVDRADRPAHVSFHRVAVEDKKASIEQGKFVGRDVDFVHITPPYSKDVFKMKVSAWLPQLQQDVMNGRIPQQWADQYIAAYKAWQNGQELPLNGTPIKGWGVISPTQQETLISMKVLTVEDLAQINDEGIRRIGMGGVDLKNKANAWLAQLQDKGPITLKMASLEQENANLRSDLDTALTKIEEFQQALKTLQSAPMTALVTGPGLVPSEQIAVADLLPEEDAPKAKIKIPRQIVAAAN